MDVFTIGFILFGVLFLDAALDNKADQAMATQANPAQVSRANTQESHSATGEDAQDRAIDYRQLQECMATTHPVIYRDLSGPAVKEKAESQPQTDCSEACPDE